MNHFPIISALTFLPLFGAILIISLGADRAKFARRVALGFSFAALALALALCGQFDSTSGALQLEENHSWIPDLGITYHVAVDGLSLLMVLLTAIVVPMAMLAS
jgi:NADH-quinone oxidoreductase subunit M